jgi:hypothetical protein
MIVGGVLAPTRFVTSKIMMARRQKALGFATWPPVAILVDSTYGERLPRATLQHPTRRALLSRSAISKLMDLADINQRTALGTGQLIFLNQRPFPIC